MRLYISLFRAQDLIVKYVKIIAIFSWEIEYHPTLKSELDTEKFSFTYRW